MGKHRTVEERHAYALRMVERNRRSMERHEQAVDRHERRGEADKASKSRGLLMRATLLGQKWSSTAHRLEPLARRSETVGRLVGRRMLERAARAAAETPERELTKREIKEREKRERLARVAAETKRKQLASANLDHWDSRTAQGAREFHIASLGASLRASVNHFDACLRKKADRTPARVLAWAKLDEHWHQVYSGLINSPKMEPGVDTSSIPGIADNRLDALKRDAALRSCLGRDMYGLLLEVIYFEKTYRELQGTGHGDEVLISGMVRRALDLAAAYYGVAEDNSFGRDRGLRQQLMCS